MPHCLFTFVHDNQKQKTGVQPIGTHFIYTGAFHGRLLVHCVILSKHDSRFTVR